MLVTNSQKEFELPDSGTFVGVVVDVVDLGVKVHPVYGSKQKLRVVWLLDKKDSEGNPFRVMQQCNAVVTDKPKESTLYTIAKKVIGTTPTTPFDTDTLIGKSNKLFIEREQDQKTQRWYANVKAILPLDGSPALAVPANFVRDQDKNKQAQPGSAPNTAQAPAAAAQGTDIPF